MKASHSCPAGIALAAALFVALPAGAQDEMGFGEEPTAEQPPPAEDEAFLKGEQTEEEALLAAPEEDPDAGRAEVPGRAYYSVGGRFRWIVVPDWFIKMFGVDLQSRNSTALLINNLAGGLEFTYRKDGFDITAAAWFIGLGWDGGVSFKGKSEDGNSWEVVTNDLQALLLTVDFIWSTEITDWFAVTYGAGLGLGIPWGDLIRTEATSGSSGMSPCVDGDDPDPWCNSDEEYGEVYDLPTGIVPWVNLLLGMRFKPHRHVALYADMGFGLGFQAGVRGAYVF
jgi:hypothetical protein